MSFRDKLLSESVSRAKKKLSEQLFPMGRSARAQNNSAFSNQLADRATGGPSPLASPPKNQNSLSGAKFAPAPSSGPGADYKTAFNPNKNPTAGAPVSSKFSPAPAPAPIATKSAEPVQSTAPKQTFSQAFAAARAEAKSKGDASSGHFTYNGKIYQTNVAGEKYKPAPKLPANPPAPVPRPKDEPTKETETPSTVVNQPTTVDKPVDKPKEDEASDEYKNLVRGSRHQVDETFDFKKVNLMAAIRGIL